MTFCLESMFEGVSSSGSDIDHYATIINLLDSIFSIQWESKS
jgi:hypothetical protein